ncbi:hypothetical protein [[Phormidium] sp. ETS-05]|uniref:hypothetical protein n=1 Tax=[Phormidium] sp. ETS-05 TaxID=222819 RepID=UPI0018EF13EA|nr:hypothetical protein [[Phormidium] sp. ETS-05]
MTLSVWHKFPDNIQEAPSTLWSGTCQSEVGKGGKVGVQPHRLSRWERRPQPDWCFEAP